MPTDWEQTIAEVMREDSRKAPAPPLLGAILEKAQRSRRRRHWGLAAACATVLVAAAGGVAVWPKGDDNSRLIVAADATCPARLPSNLSSAPGPDTASTLIPAGWQSITVCSYGPWGETPGPAPAVELLTRVSAQQMVDALNDLPQQPQDRATPGSVGSLRNCPSDNGSGHLLRVAYAEAKVLEVVASTRGCARVTNGARIVSTESAGGLVDAARAASD